MSVMDIVMDIFSNVCMGLRQKQQKLQISIQQMLQKKSEVSPTKSKH